MYRVEVIMKMIDGGGDFCGVGSASVDSNDGCGRVESGDDCGADVGYGSEKDSGGDGYDNDDCGICGGGCGMSGCF